MHRSTVRQPLLGVSSAGYGASDEVPVLSAAAVSSPDPVVELIAAAPKFCRLPSFLTRHMLSFLGACYVDGEATLILHPGVNSNSGQLFEDLRDICSFARVNRFTHSIVRPFSYRVIDLMRPALSIDNRYRNFSLVLQKRCQVVIKKYKRDFMVISALVAAYIATSMFLCYLTFQGIPPVDLQGGVFISLAISGAVGLSILIGMGLSEFAIDDYGLPSPYRVKSCIQELDSFKLTLQRIITERPCLMPVSPDNYRGYSLPAFSQLRADQFEIEFAARRSLGVTDVALSEDSAEEYKPCPV